MYFPVFASNPDNFAQSQQHKAASHDVVFYKLCQKLHSLPGGVKTLIQGPGILVQDDVSGGRANAEFLSDATVPPSKNFRYWANF